MRLFRCRADWLAALQALPLFDTEFSAWGSVFGLAVEWLRHQQQVRRAAKEARDVADEVDGWEEHPGGQAAPVRSNSSTAAERVKNTGRGLEEYCALLLQLRGYSQTSVKGGPRDGGIDLLAARQLPNSSSGSAAMMHPSSRTDMAAVQCKEYYNSQSYYHATVTTEEVRAFHSCIVGLEFFNLQQMDFNDRRTRADTGSSSSSIASLSLLPPTPQLIADTRTLSVAYLITSGTFAQQARDFSAAFNASQERKWPMGRMQNAEGGVAGTQYAEEPPLCPPFKGHLHLIDGTALCAWLEEADAQDPEAMPRLEIQRACALLTQCRCNLRLFAEQREAELQLDYSSWPWQQQLRPQSQHPHPTAGSPSTACSSSSLAAVALCDSLVEDLAQQFCQAVVSDQ